MLKPPTRRPALSVTSSNLQLPRFPIEHVAAIAGDVNVLPAVVVEVGDRNAHAPAFAGKAGLLRDVAKFQIALLTVERDHQIAALAIAIDRRSVDRDDVEFAVVVAVDEADAAAHRFQDVALFGSGIMRARSGRRPC